MLRLGSPFLVFTKARLHEFFPPCYVVKVLGSTAVLVKGPSEVRHVAKLIGCLFSVCKGRLVGKSVYLTRVRFWVGPNTALTRQSNACLYPKTLGVEAEGSELQGYFCLYMEFEASMVYVIFHLYKKNK